MTDEEKIRKAAAEGRVKWSPEASEYFARAGVVKGGADADFSIVSVSANFWGRTEDGLPGSNLGGMEIKWSTVSAGFGSLAVYIDKDGVLRADTEAMGREFCKTVLAKLAETWEQT